MPCDPSFGKYILSGLVNRTAMPSTSSSSAAAAISEFQHAARKNEHMQLPVIPPVSPMLAKSVTAIPPDASYEPKWDGFRSICFRDGDQVELGSRNERPMTRYFPELVAAIRPSCRIAV